MELVIAGLVPATPINGARPCHTIGVAGTSPAMTDLLHRDMLQRVASRMADVP